jgi:pSer/pThr/pTyr-binding forkhead associated (FHA) protein
MTDPKSTLEAMVQDHLVVRHPDGAVAKIPLPTESGAMLKLGRELDNDLVLEDPKVSRYHAQVRRAEGGNLEIFDLGSANGTIVGTTRLKSNEWRPLAAGQGVMLGDTNFFWEQAGSSQTTVAMAPVAEPVVGVPASPKRDRMAYLPWLIGLATLAAIVAIVWIFFNAIRSTSTPTTEATTAAAGPVDITQQTPEGAPGSGPESTRPPTEAAETSDRPLAPALPAVSLEKVEFLPVISGALFDTQHVYMIVSVRVENLGDEPFTVSTKQFWAETDTGQRIKELGQEFAPSEFKRLGVKDRFDALLLRSGGSVPEELIFYLDTESYHLTLYFEPEGFDPLNLGLGAVAADQELAALLGTPTAEPTTAVAIAAATATPKPTATPTVRPTSAGGFARTIPARTLVGTIAYADFDGNTYNLYFGDVASGESFLWRPETSQPIFSNGGERIAYHSWANNSRGLLTSNLDHSNGFLVATFLEDQLPTWSSDDGQIMFLSRRTGGRQSQLYLAPSAQERPEAQFILEGEYPTWHGADTVVFKGWVSTGIGLRVATGGNMNDYEELTNHDGDTAPSISPNGKKVVFMSNRNNNWDVYVVNIDGSGLTQLTFDEALDGLPTWSPDGRAIAFVSNRGGPWAVWAMTPSGTGIRQLFTYQGSPDGFVASEPTLDTTRGWAEERISWTKTTF